MLKRLVSLLLIVSIFIAVPLISVELFRNKAPSPSKKSAPKSRTEILTAQLAAEFSEDYCDEALEAIAIVLNSNYDAKNPAVSDRREAQISRQAFLKKYTNGELYYSKLENIVAKTNGKTLKYCGETVYIPLTELSAGYTVPSKDYPYLKAAPSPWDVLEKSVGKNTAQTAVSLNGINELCKSGLSAAQALRHYIDYD